MLYKVEARSIQGNLLTLELDDISDGLIVKEIGGLDPVKATLVSSSFAQIDGAQYQSSRRETRNIKLKLGLDPDPAVDTVGGLRSRLYNFFMPKAPVTLRFYMEEGLVVDIPGRVESCETPLFAREPEVDVSILCFNPDFYELDPVVVSGASTSGTTETLVTYDGTVETGFVFTLNVDRTLPSFTLYHRTPADDLLQLDFAASLVSGDVLTISTVTGAKGATLTHLGSSSSLLRGVSPQSSWTEFSRGDNYIRVYAPGAAVPFTITYTNRYGGL